MLKVKQEKYLAILGAVGRHNRTAEIAYCTEQFFSKHDTMAAPVLASLYYELGKIALTWFFSCQPTVGWPQALPLFYQILALLEMGLYDQARELDLTVSVSMWEDLETRIKLNPEQWLHLAIGLNWPLKRLPYVVRGWLKAHPHNYLSTIYLLQRSLYQQQDATPQQVKELHALLDLTPNSPQLKNLLLQLLGCFHDPNELEKVTGHIRPTALAYKEWLTQASLTDIIAADPNYVAPAFRRAQPVLDNYRSDELQIYSYRSNEKLKSMHLIVYKQQAIVLDCGAAPTSGGGMSEIPISAWLSECGVEPQEIKAVFISHAHLDHYGSIQQLLKLCDVPVYLTKQTAKLINFTSRALRQARVREICSAMPVQIGPFTVKCFAAGHLLGAVGFDIAVNQLRIVYTGDFSLSHPYQTEALNLMALAEGSAIDILIMETTYGSRKQDIPRHYQLEIFCYLINQLYVYQEAVFIPAFAMGRAQELANLIDECGQYEGEVVIAGLASSLTRYVKQFNKATQNYHANILLTQHLNNSADIVIASSGMLQQNSTSFNYYDQWPQGQWLHVIRCGYMQPDNLALADIKARRGHDLSLYEVPLSAHASYNQLLATIYCLKPRQLVLVHGNGIKLD